MTETSINYSISKYIEHLHDSTLTYKKRGEYIEAAWAFLCKSECSKKGYLSFVKNNRELLVKYPFYKEGILNYLNFCGKGFKKDTTKKRKSKKLIFKKQSDNTIDEKVNKFLEYCQKENDFSNHTLYNYSYTIRLFYSYFDKFSNENCKLFVQLLEEQGRNPRTINLRMQGLNHLSKCLKVPIALKQIKVQKSLSTENIPSENEYNRLCEYLQNNRKTYWLFIIKVLATTGCRASELIQFTYRQIIDGHCTIKGKGNKYRQFFFIPEIQKLALAVIDLDADIDKKIYTKSSRNINLNLRQFADKCNIPREKMHAHAFRHFFAKQYLSKTNDIVGLADILGHSSLDMTRLYSQKSYAEQKQDYIKAVKW